MRKGLFSLLAAGALLAIPMIADAQAPGAPKVLLIVREDIKTGKMAPHAGEANNTVQIWAKAKSPYHRLAMTPVAGNENEVTYLWPFESFAALEKSGRDLDEMASGQYKADFDRVQNRGEDYHAAQRDSIAVLRDDLSYRPGADIAHMRFMRVETVRVKPGQARAWEEARKMVKLAHEKANIEENMAIYQVVGGTQAGTYITFIPWKSLDGLATLPHGKNYQDAMGEDNMKKVDKMYEESITFDEISVYAFNPQLSYLSAEMVAQDPGFWTFKPMPMPGGQVLAEKRVPAKGIKPQR